MAVTPPTARSEDRRPLAERIRPMRVEEVVGNRDAIDRVMEWAKAWAASIRPPRWRAVILSGPAGVGKTTLAWAVARAFGWTVVEMNASDARNQAAVEQIAGRASLSHTLGEGGVYRTPREGGRTLILVDEADCLTSAAASGTSTARASGPTLREFLIGRYGSVDALNRAWGLGGADRPVPFDRWTDVPATSGRGGWTRLAEAQRDLADWKDESRRKSSSDRGGYGAIVRLVETTHQPVVLTVNDERELARHAPALRGHALRVPFGPVGEGEMRSFLRRTIGREHLAIATPALDAIVSRTHGDLRAAVNDLEAVAPLPPGPLQQSVLSVRDLTSDLFDVTGSVLTEPRFYRSWEIRDRLDATPDDLWPWMEENVPRFAPTAVALERGLERVREAELHLSRARRQRVFALWSFASELLTGGVGLALASDTLPASGTVAFPQFLSAMGRSRGARATRDGLLGKTGRLVHASRRKSGEAFLPLFRQLVQAGPGGRRLKGRREAFEQELELTEEEVALLGAGAVPVGRGTPEGTPPSRGAGPSRDPTHSKGQRQLGEY